MQPLFWRRLWIYDLETSRWNVVLDDSIRAWNAFECYFEGYSWCKEPQPYVYEQWWSYTASTIGTSTGSWNYLGARINWGSNPVVA